MHAHLFDALCEHVAALLALAAAAQFADAGDQEVRRRDGLAVVVQAHVERLDFLGVIGDEHRPPEVLFGEVPLMLGLKVAAPEHRVFEGCAGIFEDFDRVGVADAREVRVPDGFQPVDEALVDEAV